MSKTAVSVLSMILI